MRMMDNTEIPVELTKLRDITVLQVCKWKTE